MTVHEVDLFPKPPGSRFDYYAQLDCNESDDKFLDSDCFRGRPFPKKWRRVDLHFDHPLWPRADFCFFRNVPFVCNERARKLAGPALEKAGEFLPVSIEGEKGTHYIYNVTNCEAKLDPVKSIWQFYEPKKLTICIVAPAFNPSGFGRETIFKVPDRGGRVYCLERTGDYRDGEFKALVEHHKLTGLKFEFIWNDKRGPKPLNPPITRGMELRDGRGKVLARGTGRPQERLERKWRAKWGTLRSF